MKKLLSILGAIVLVGTTSVSAVACSRSGEKPKPAVTKTDLSKLNDNAVVNGVIEKNVDSFIDKLVAVLKTQTEFSSLSTKDIDVYQGNNLRNPLTNNEIVTNNALKIKVEAKPSSTLFSGVNSISVNLTTTAVTKTDLSTLTQLTSLNIIVSPIQNNDQLKSEILKANEFKIKPIVEYEIKYFSDAQGKTEVSNNKQQAGELYVVITANKNDQNWIGATPKLKIVISKKDLNTIFKLTGLNIIANPIQKYDDLWSEILKANEFKNLEYNSYETFMYKTDHFTDKTSIKSLNQEIGIIYVALKFSSTDSINWIGITPRLEIILS